MNHNNDPVAFHFIQRGGFFSYLLFKNLLGPQVLWGEKRGPDLDCLSFQLFPQIGRSPEYGVSFSARDRKRDCESRENIQIKPI